MAKPVAPLLSFSASGTIAKTQVYSSWRGRQYVRRYAIPSNPNTMGQQQTREVFAWLQAVWKASPTDFQAPWNGFIKGRPLTARNALTMFNVPVLRSGSTLADMIASPGSAAGIAAASMTTTPGSGSLTVAVTAPALPTGWTITEMVACAIKDQDPHSGLEYAITIGSDSSSPYSIVLSGLTASQLYRTFAWPVWAKPDGSVAYGPSLISSGTPS